MNPQHSNKAAPPTLDKVVDDLMARMVPPPDDAKLLDHPSNTASREWSERMNDMACARGWRLATK